MKIKKRVVWPIILWVIFAGVAVLNAFVRETFYQEKLGELLSHQISTGIFIVLVLGIMLLFFNLSKIKYTKKELWIIGIAWFLATVFFEFLAGHYVFGNSWQNLLSDYNFLKGRLWALVLITTLIGPRITSWKHKKKPKYKRKAKKNGKPRMSKQRKWLILGIIFGVLVIATLILFIFVKPEFLNGIFHKQDNPAGVSPGGTAHVKEENNAPSTTTTNTNTKPRTTTPKTNSPSSPPPEPQPIDNSVYYANLANLLSQTPMVQDLPEGEQILLRFYNFNTGYREFEKSYILTTGSAKEGFIDNPEITIVMHSKYLPELSNDNLCATIIKAQSNDDLGIYTDLSTTKIIMKFKSMMKYKDCLM